MSKNTRNRILLTAVAALMLVTLTIGGTLAWLKAETTPVTNTFKTTSITVDVVESKVQENGSLDTTTKVEANEYTLIPNVNLNKDPDVVVTTSVDAYVFLMVDTTQWVGDALKDIVYFTVDGDVWTAVPDRAGVYYKEVKASDSEQTFGIIEGDIVYVTDKLTEKNMPSNTVSVAFDACAIQKTGLTEGLTMAAIFDMANTPN